MRHYIPNAYMNCFFCLLQELCGKGSILFLAQSILKLNMKSSIPTKIVAAISRLKAKILSIVSILDAISYLFKFNLLQECTY